MRILFYTCIFSDGDRLPQDEPGPFERMKGCDYLCLHNCPHLAQDRTDWRLVRVRELPKGMPGRVFSRMVKFDPWSHLPDVASYDLVVYCDVFLSPLPRPELWAEVARLAQSHDLVIQRHWCPNMRDQLDGLSTKRDSRERLDAMGRWLAKRGVDLDSADVPRYSNKFFAFAPGNPAVAAAFAGMCAFLRPNDVCHRDQPAASYFYPKHGVRDVDFKIGDVRHPFAVTGWRARKNPGGGRIHPPPPPPGRVDRPKGRRAAAP